jgi:hypothetical protein
MIAIQVHPTDLLVQYLASTFILVLNWWLESRSLLPPKEVNDLFCALILPALAVPGAGRVLPPQWSI